jgi:signal transduction histidine kinase
MLRDFLMANREQLLHRAAARANERNTFVAAPVGRHEGLPHFLDQLDEALRRATADASADATAIGQSAGEHGGALFRTGLTIAQVVRDYGDLCQAITSLAAETGVSIPPDEFKVLSLSLDDAIAGAVTEYARLRDRAIEAEGTERLGVLAHEMRNQLNAAMLTFTSIRRGFVPAGGSTGAMHEKSLSRLQRLIDRSLVDVRLERGAQLIEPVAVWELFEEIEIGALMYAQQRGVSLAVSPVERDVVVDVDRQNLVAAIANLLQNAFKFSRDDGKVALRVSTTSTRVLIDVEDECGGLPSGDVENLFRPFVQEGGDRSGLGLGLSIASKAVRSMSGELRARDLPGKGCVFTIDLPKRLPPPTPIRGGVPSPAERERSAEGVEEARARHG